MPEKKTKAGRPAKAKVVIPLTWDSGENVFKTNGETLRDHISYNGHQFFGEAGGTYSPCLEFAQVRVHNYNNDRATLKAVEDCEVGAKTGVVLAYRSGTPEAIITVAGTKIKCSTITVSPGQKMTMAITFTTRKGKTYTGLLKAHKEFSSLFTFSPKRIA